MSGQGWLRPVAGPRRMERRWPLDLQHPECFKDLERDTTSTRQAANGKACSRVGCAREGGLIGHRWRCGLLFDLLLNWSLDDRLRHSSLCATRAKLARRQWPGRVLVHADAPIWISRIDL